MANAKPALVVAGILSAAAMTATATMNSEGWKLTPYKDVNGKWTVCGGETHDVDPHRIYTQKDCVRMFVTSLVSHGVDISECLPDDVPTKIEAAYQDFAYNVGSKKFCSSSVAKFAQAGDYPRSCEAILLYKKAGALDCSVPANNCYGVWLRRQREYNDCLKGTTK